MRSGVRVGERAGRLWPFLLLPAMLVGCAERTRPDQITLPPVEPRSAPPMTAMDPPGQLPEDLADWRDSEQTPVLPAERLLDPQWLDGPLYRLDRRVPVSGGLGVFTAVTRFGEMQTESRELLQIRLAELSAIEMLAEQSRFRTFVDATGEAASRTGQALANVAADPVGTVQGLPSGVARYFRQGYRSLRRTTLDAADAARLERKDNEQGEGDAVTDADEMAGDASQSPAERAALRLIGYQSARRELARRLDVDPHTTNPLLSAQLDELAWSGLAGRAGFGVALGATGALAQVASATGRLNRLVWELTPMQIRDHNERVLANAGFSGRRARAFLRNGAFHPSLQLDFCAAISELAQVEGRWALIELATEAQDEVEARFLVNFLHMLLQYQRDTGAVVTAIETGAEMLWVRTSAGGVVLLAPVDYLSATAWLENLIRDPQWHRQAARQPRIRVAGLVSPAAMTLLQRNGWTIESGVGLGRTDRS